MSKRILAAVMVFPVVGMVVVGTVGMVVVFLDIVIPLSCVVKSVSPSWLISLRTFTVGTDTHSGQAETDS